MVTGVLAGAAMFVFVFLRAWQQRNVMGMKYSWVLPTSMCMAVFEAYIYYSVVTNYSFEVVVFLGLGGGLGCMASMFLHHKYITKDEL